MSTLGVSSRGRGGEPDPNFAAFVNPLFTEAATFDRELELDRLRRRLDDAQVTIEALSHAVETLKRGARALREENAELRRELAIRARGAPRHRSGTPSPRRSRTTAAKAPDAISATRPSRSDG